MHETRSIGNIGNYYGGLNVKEEGGRYFWGILDHDDDVDWEEIPESLYVQLLIFQNSKEAAGDE